MFTFFFASNVPILGDFKGDEVRFNILPFYFFFIIPKMKSKMNERSLMLIEKAGSYIKFTKKLIIDFDREIQNEQHEGHHCW